MKLCAIVPTEYLDWTSRLAGRFCLANEVLRSLKYYDYFKKAQGEGYEVILDNGVFESQLLPEAVYLDLINRIEPSIAIAPDGISGNAQEGLNEAIQFAKKVQTISKKSKIMWVPQCQRNDWLHFEKALEAIADIDEIEYIGICRDAVYNAYGQFTHTDDQELNRFYFCGSIQHDGILAHLLDKGKKFHFLGIGERYDILPYYWFVESMDTASLFTQSVCGHYLRGEGRLETKLKRPDDFFKRKWFQNTEDEECAYTIFSRNCIEAQSWADKATRLKLQLEGKRL